MRTTARTESECNDRLRSTYRTVASAGATAAICTMREEKVDFIVWRFRLR
jgi:hypothetical protein